MQFKQQQLTFSMLACCQDAYNAVQANPVAASALGNLLRLVNALVNTGNIATLCSLPYAADFIVKQQDGRYCTACVLPSLTQLSVFCHAVWTQACYQQIMHCGSCGSDKTGRKQSFADVCGASCQSIDTAHH